MTFPMMVPARKRGSKFFWILGHLIAEIGCRIEGDHAEPREDLVDDYCQKCGRRRW